MKSILLLLLLLAYYSNISAQPTTDATRKTGMAVRADRPPKLDGDLDDICWQNAPIMSDFVTNSPVFGKPSAEKAQVRVVYTDEAIYVGA